MASSSPSCILGGQLDDFCTLESFCSSKWTQVFLTFISMRRHGRADIALVEVMSAGGREVSIMFCRQNR